VSSNFATNLLIERLGAKNVQRTTESLGAAGMHVLRGVEDDKAFRQGLNNTTTARGLMTLMEKIAKGEAVDKPSSDEMIAILERQHFNDRIPAGLPERSEEHTSELQSLAYLVCRLLLEKKNNT